MVAPARAALIQALGWAGGQRADDLRGMAVRLIGEGHTGRGCGAVRDKPEHAWPLPLAVSHDWQRSAGQVRRLQGLCVGEAWRRSIAKQPDLTLLEIQARLAEAKVKVAASSVFRFLRSLGVTF